MNNIRALIFDPYNDVSEGHFPEYREHVSAEALAKGIQITKVTSLTNIFSSNYSQIYFINFNLGSIKEVKQHFLIIFAYLARKDVRVVVHSLSKFVLINRIFLSLPLNFFVFSRAFFAYTSNHKIPVKNINLIDFPNASLGSKIVPRCNKRSTWDIAIWGNANKNYFDANKFKKNVPSSARCHLGSGCHQHRDILTSMGYTVVCHATSDKSGLQAMLSVCSHFSMQFITDFDYYEKKVNASGVFLTSQEAGLVGICDFLWGYYIEDLKYSGRHILVDESKIEESLYSDALRINTNTSFERLFL